MLYATSCDKPHLVPIFLICGTYQLKTTDHLFTQPWINEFGREATMMRPNMFRNSFSKHPINDAPLPFNLTICHENGAECAKNFLLASLVGDDAGKDNIFMPFGNILVMKTCAARPGEVIDVNPDDEKLITDIILR